MTDTLSYRLVQFCPTPIDDVRINIGVEVSDGHTRHLEMLPRPDLQARCRVLSGHEPATGNSVLADLLRYAKELTRYSSADGIDVRVGVEAPALMTSAERFNNLLQLSAPRNVVYGNLTETARFLLRNLAPPVDRPSRNRVRDRIRKEIIAAATERPNLKRHTLDRPFVEAGSLDSRMDFGFHDDSARAIGRVFNFDRDVEQSFIDSVSSTVLMFDRIRNRGANVRTASGKAQYSISHDAVISVIHTEPKDGRARELFEHAKQEWSELAVQLVPATRQNLALDAAERALAGV